MSPAARAARSAAALRPRRRAAVTRYVLAVAISACGLPQEGPDDPELSQFAADVLVRGMVLENVTACEVDADCYLRIEFADTTLVALYGSGERPAPQCEIPGDVSDAAFRLERGEIVQVVVSMCGADGYYLRQLALRVLVSIDASDSAVELPTFEHDYEMPAAVVLARDDDWFHIRIAEGSSWIRRSGESRFIYAR